MRKFFLFIFVCFSAVTSFSGNIIINGKSYTMDTVANFKVGPGVNYTAIELRGDKRLNVFFLKTDVTNPYISYKSALGRDSIYSGERPTSVAARKSKEGSMYIAGTNGDFYETSGNIGYPIGVSLIEKEIAKTPINWRLLAFDENKVPYVGTMTYSGNISFGTTTFPINHTNHIRGENQLVLYNQYNGKYTRTNSFGTEVLVKLSEGETWGTNKNIKVKVLQIEKDKGAMAIPAGLAVLSGHGTAQSVLNTLNIGDEVTITFDLILDGVASSYITAVGGDRRETMLQNGVVNTTEVWNELHPRTGFGYSQDKKTVIHCVVDGRGVSAGATTKELAELMLYAGAYTAFNLDGGGSSCLFVKDFGPMNTPSDGSERAVSNGIYIVSSAPTDNVITEIEAYESTIKLPRYGVLKPKFLGYNQYGTLINKDLNPVSLSCNEELGFINEQGQLVASGEKGGILNASYNGITTKVKIDIVQEAEIKIRLDSLLIDNRREYPIEVQSIVGLNTMSIYPDALTWTVKDPEVCTVTKGIVKGVKNGITTVFGNLGTYKDSLKIKVEIPSSGQITFDKFNVNDWKMEATSTFNATMSNTNLPSNWEHGAVINFNYSPNRVRFVKLSRNISFYSLPDTLKIKLNLGDILLNKAILSLKRSNSTQSITKEFIGLPNNRDAEIIVPLDKLFDTSDIATYPIGFEYLNFYLEPQTSTRPYTLAVKDISLFYKGLSVTYLSTKQMEKFQVYPNPLIGNTLYLKFMKDFSRNATVTLYNMNGQTLYSKYIIGVSSEVITISLPNLVAGSYLMKIQQNKNSEVVKLIVK